MTDMACEHARLLLCHQLDGGLNALDTANLDRHLAQCAACRATAAALWRQDRLLVELRSAPIVDALAARIESKLNQLPLGVRAWHGFGVLGLVFGVSRPPWRVGRARTPRWAAASLALAAAVLLAIVVPLARRPADPARPLPAAGSGEPAGGALSRLRSGDVLVDGLPSRVLGADSSVQVVGDQPAVIRLTDGSEAEFEPGTAALVHDRAAGARPWIELNEGSGTFRVAKAGGEFQVTTQLGRVTALGTEFSVGLWPSPTLGDMTMKMRNALLAVAVMSGMVKVEFDGRTFVLGGGESRVFGQDRGAAPAAEGGRGAAAATAEGRARVPAEGGRAAGGERGDRAPSFAVRGRIESVDKTKVTLKTRPGSTDYELAPDAVVTIDRKPAKVEDLAAGMDVILDRKSDGGPVTIVNVQPPIVSGDVKSVGSDGKSITIVSISRANSEQTFALADNVVIHLTGREPAQVADIQPGMPVVLRLTADKKTALSINRIQPRAEGEAGTRRGERDKPAATPDAKPAAGARQ